MYKKRLVGLVGLVLVAWICSKQGLFVFQWQTPMMTGKRSLFRLATL